MNDEYNFIINPKTNRNVKITSKLGKELLQKYFEQSGGACAINPKTGRCKKSKKDDGNCELSPKGRCRKVSNAAAGAGAPKSEPKKTKKPKKTSGPKPKKNKKEKKPARRGRGGCSGELSYRNKIAPDGYIESQVAAHCLKHALNHVFQQDIVVINNKIPDKRIPRMPQEGLYSLGINLFGYCREKVIHFGGDQDARPEEILALANDFGFCDAAGNYYSAYAEQILTDLGFNYKSPTGPGGYIRNDDNPILNWASIRNDLNHPDCIGCVVLMLNPDYRSGHFTAISKNFNDCEEQPFTYMDSVGERFVCGDINDMITLLSGGRINEEHADEWASVIEIPANLRTQDAEFEWYHNKDETLDRKREIIYEYVEARYELALREINAYPAPVNDLSTISLAYIRQFPIDIERINRLITTRLARGESRQEAINAELLSEPRQTGAVYDSIFNVIQNENKDRINTLIGNAFLPNQTRNCLKDVTQIITIFRTPRSIRCRACI